jgi:hypothetical protein
MKKADVKIGGQYFATVSGRRVVVKIDAEVRGGGWNATNQTTGKQVRIKTAQRLTPMAGTRIHTPPANSGPADGPAEESPTTENVQSPRAKRSKKVTDPVTDPEPSAAGEKKLSAIAAAAKVLAEVGQPMNAKQLIEAMAERGYWTSPGGKTPEATLYAAIAREIKTKGEQSRFTNPDRGLFAPRT